MSRVRVHNFSISLDGFGTGEGQSLEAPFGHAGHRLNEWFFATRTFQEMLGKPGGSAGVDDAFARDWGPGIGAEIMGRNKFGYQRGPWVDEEWKGWWGNDPPFHTPVFILTHHPRPAISMEGGTTFHFMDASPAEALKAASGRWVGCPNWWRTVNRSTIPGSRPHRLHARRRGADRSGTGGTAVGWSRRSRAALPR
jgi:dihydrofolate reductase